MSTMTRPPGRRTRTTSLVIVGAVLGLALAACGSSPPNPRPVRYQSYAALGDSYSAGVALTPLTDATCLRSSSNYAGLLANKLHITNLDDVTCGGATSANLTTPQVSVRGTNPPQLDALNSGTNLVTLGIGLNDFGLSYGLLYVCLPVNGQTTAACTKYLNTDPAGIAAYIKEVGVMVSADIDAIRHDAPHARIVLVGYPRLLPDDRYCPTQVPVPNQAADRIRETLRSVNTTFINVAKRQRIDYIDMYTASKGHEVCSSDPWVNGQSTIPGEAYPFHPFASYHAAVADKLYALLKH